MLHLVAVELHHTVPSRNSPSPLRINDLHPLWSNPPELSHNPPIRPLNFHHFFEPNRAGNRRMYNQVRHWEPKRESLWKSEL